MLLGGESDLVPGHDSCIHVTGCTKVAGFGDFHLSHINCLRGCQGPGHMAKCINLGSGGSIHYELPAKSPAKRMCLCSLAGNAYVEERLLSTTCLKSVGLLNLCLRK